MKVIFLGTNGWYTSPTGNTACILLDTKDHYIILDAGNGFYKLDQYIKEDKPVSLFISHFHLDHVSGLHTLAKFSFPKGLDVYVGLDRKRDFETLINPPYTIGCKPQQENIRDLPFPIRLHELTPGDHEVPFPVSVFTQEHAYGDHSYRFTLENKIIAYSGDCGISANSERLAKFADLLIHECSFTEPETGLIWGHVTASQAAALAQKNAVKKLLLTHFDPMKFETLDKRVLAEKEAQTIFPNSTAAYDDMEVVV